ncbi:acyl carrier protein [Nocardia sp. BMG51109]|uniref:acyl carrier protein n=1 Tax=Nocardia sp. BMG51109 TaxID=1056816 RepID=UPI0004657558|nr:acyl carrier protein [Nocardia sp. BMG51109]
MITTHEITDLMTGLDATGDDLRPDVPLEDQGIDSMDMTTLLVRIERTYSVAIPATVADELQTLDQLVDYVNSVEQNDSPHRA